MQWYWLIHHDVLCEPLTEPIEQRIAYIRANKPTHEVQTRLLWMRPVQEPERLPVQVIEAWEAYFEAGKACMGAWEAYFEAGKAYDEAGKAHYADIRALHMEECPGCPWDGKKLVFPETLNLDGGAQ